MPIFSSTLSIGDWIYLTGLSIAALWWGRAAFFLRHRDGRGPRDVLDKILTAAFGLAIGVLPTLSILTGALDAFEYEFTTVSLLIGSILLACAVTLLCSAMINLGGNWSFRPDTRTDQTLVTKGIYRFIRHPAYASYWLWAFSQPLLVHNWVGGWATCVVFPVFYFYRVGKEERFLLDRFGESYRKYQGRTGRVIPRIQAFLSTDPF